VHWRKRSRQRWSSAHWLFPTAAEDLEPLLEVRVSCPGSAASSTGANPGYRDFQDFLDTLTAKRRKNINRERRLVQRGRAVNCRCLHGEGTQRGAMAYRSTNSTVPRSSAWAAIPTLTLALSSQDIAATLGDRLVVGARLLWQGREIATALCFRSATTLYGRHWGCRAEYDSLHFEACYYQGIDYCIRQGLLRFEPGAQGEHKIHRGFLPTLTHSAHWIAHPAFRRAIVGFLARETPAVRNYARELLQHSPYRNKVMHDALAVAGPV
jgi:predicted N-acyltransferase